MVMNKSELIHTTETIVILVGAVLGRYPRETLSRWWPTRGSDRYSCFLGIGHGKGSLPQLLGRDGRSCNAKRRKWIGEPGEDISCIGQDECNMQGSRVRIFASSMFFF